MADGLVDNAGSVVAVIEAAKILREAPLSHRIRIIFFDQEELGLIGARKWIEAHGLANVAAVVNSDVAAYGDTMMYGQNNGPQSAFVTRAVQELCAEQALQCVGFPIYPPSDDRAFGGGRAGGLAGFPGRGRRPPDVAGLQRRKDERPGRRLRPAGFPADPLKDDAIEAVEGEAIDLAGRTYAALIRKLDAQLR